MRMFVAVGVPDGIKEKMGRLSSELPEEGIRRVDPGLMHITLKFLGEIEEGKLGEIKKRLGKVEFPPFTARVRGVGVFPNRNYVRVVWAGVEGEGLGELALKVGEALSGFGKKEAFSAHLTLARAYKKVEVENFLEKHSEEEFGEFRIKSFELMQSVLGRGKPVHSVLKEFGAKEA